MIHLQREIPMRKNDVIVALRKNKAKHIQEYKKATEGFQKKATQLLEKELKAIKKGKLTLYVQLQSPIDRRENFDVAINMFYSINDVIVKLTTAEYNEYILDKGNAAISASASNSTYFSTASSRRK